MTSFKMITRRKITFENICNVRPGSKDFYYKKKMCMPYIEFYEANNCPELPNFKEKFKEVGLEFRKEMLTLIPDFNAIYELPCFNLRSWNQINNELKSYVLFYILEKYENEFYQFIVNHYGPRLVNPQKFFNSLKSTIDIQIDSSLFDIYSEDQNEFINDDEDSYFIN